MFNIFKKNKEKQVKNTPSFEIELTAAVLAYEIARSDGDVSSDELSVLIEEIDTIAKKVGKEKTEILKIVETYSQDSVSFHEFIQDINKEYSKDQKLSLIEFLWKTAYADGRLDVDEERLVRRIADLIKIKHIEVLKLKDLIKN
ncbi:MAG: TerB family tellurite resistance protein [Gammaproteobacteria bacterium]